MISRPPLRLTKPIERGGLNLGTIGSSIVLASILVLFIVGRRSRRSACLKASLAGRFRQRPGDRRQRFQGDWSIIIEPSGEPSWQRGQAPGAMASEISELDTTAAFVY